MGTSKYGSPSINYCDTWRIQKAGAQGGFESASTFLPLMNPILQNWICCEFREAPSWEGFQEEEEGCGHFFHFADYPFLLCHFVSLHPSTIRWETLGSFLISLPECLSLTVSYLSIPIHFAWPHPSGSPLLSSLLCPIVSVSQLVSDLLIPFYSSLCCSCYQVSF